MLNPPTVMLPSNTTDDAKSSAEIEKKIKEKIGSDTKFKNIFTLVNLISEAACKNQKLRKIVASQRFRFPAFTSPEEMSESISLENDWST